MPKRIQRKRTKGWQMPENAVYVGRPTKWGNPFPVNDPLLPHGLDITQRRQMIVEEYRKWLTGNSSPANLAVRKATILANLEVLRGIDLVCWCPLDRPCHADVLLELVNEEE